MKYKMLVLDIDGTLTNSEKQITDNTLSYINKIQELGVYIVLATGRPTPGVQPIAHELLMDQFGGYILSFNGGKIINCKTNETIYEKVIEAKDVKRLYDLARANDVNIISYENNNVIMEIEHDQYAEIESRIVHMPIKKVDSFRDYINFPVNKCIMTGDGDYLAGVEKIVQGAIGSELSVYRSEPYFLEIMPQHIDKAQSIGRLIEKLGISKDEVIACGDGFNDLSMIKYAGLGVAMENAQDIVKENADYITLSNDNEGIVHVINEFMLNS